MIDTRIERQPGRVAMVPSLDGLWAAIAVLLPAVVTLFGRTMAIDLAYQIRAGNIMLDTRHVLDVDTFTFTVSGQPWLNQQWGAQVLMALVHRTGGWGGILLASGVLVGVTAFFVYQSCRAVGAAPRTSCLLTVCGSVVGLEILDAMRPQQFGFVLFAACLWIVSTRRFIRGRLWLLPVLVVVWTNLHGSFPLVFVVIGLAWVRDRQDDPPAARRLLIAATLCAAATIVNPYGLRVWGYVADLSTHPVVSRRISEWGPPSIHTPTGIFFFVSLLAVALFLARRGMKTSWLSMLALGVYAVLSLLAIRGVVWWALAAPIVVADLLSDGARRRSPERTPLNLAFAAALGLLVATSLPFGRGTDPASGGPAVLTFAPEHLVASAREAAPAGSRAFVSQLTASWTEYSAPELPVAVDSRIEIFPASVWDDYFVVSTGQEGWREILSRWDVKILILHDEQASGLLGVIDDHPEWRLVIRNDDGAVYVRTDLPRHVRDATANARRYGARSSTVTGFRAVIP